MPNDALPAILAYIVGEWQRLRPIRDAPPPRGGWILAHEPVPAETVHGISTSVTDAWYGNAHGVRERNVDSVPHLRTNAAAWVGRPYRRRGWVDIAPLVNEPVCYLEFAWGSLYAYGLQAFVV